MCGITGFLTIGGLERDAGDQLRRMTDALRHRGPDDAGHWLDSEAGIALGHRRLSILDLTPEGHQPMISHDGRWVIVLNGEFYNFGELRAGLEARGVAFRGHSDTEVFLEGVARWGLTATIERTAGMFAFALWDRATRELHLVRDRFGEKPLYFGRAGRTILFGSEFKALCAHPAWNGTIDRSALTSFMRFNYVPAPYSIYSGMRKVRPGHRALIRADGTVEETAYWSLADVAVEGMANPLRGTDDELVAMLEERLRATIRQEMVADVPLGALLSGGIDSSAVVALMQAESSRPVKTFTIGFHEPGYNEAEHAKAVARHLGTEHTELYLTSAEAQAVIPQLPALYDEPFADSSQIPTFLVARLARAHVTVALSGDGGDEMFGGYNRYFLGDRIWRKLAPMPQTMRRGAAAAIRSLTPATWGAVFSAAQSVLPPEWRVAHAGDRMHKLAGVLAVSSSSVMYRTLVSHWQDPASLVVRGSERETLHLGTETVLRSASFIERMMYVDAMTYLPDDIMVKVDRASMGVSLESRAPFLDHRVAQFAWRLPLRLKVRRREGKWALRQVLYGHVPPSLLDRPKMGFGIPLDSWLRGPLREWAADLLASDRLRREGYFEPADIETKWREHLSGARNWQYPLWTVLMFQSWLAGWS